MINIENFDNIQSFKWYLIRYLHPVDHLPGRIRKINRIFGKRELDFKDMKFPVKFRDITKVFLVMKARKNIQSMCQKTLSKDMLIYYC